MVKNKLAKKTSPKASKSTSLLERINNIRSRVDQNLGAYKDDYLILRTDDEVKNYFDKIIKNKLAAIDTETTGLNFFSDSIVGICLYTEGEKAAYIPINHISSIYQTRVENQANEETLRILFKLCLDNQVKFIYHNAKFDMNFLESFLGFPLVKPYWDTLVASHLITNDEHKRGLKDQYNKYCSQYEDEEKAKKLSSFNDLFDGLRFDYIPIDCGYIYAARDAYMTYQLYRHQADHFNMVENQGVYELFRNIEMPIVEVTASMQRVGVDINMELANKLKTEYEDKIAKITDRIYNEIDKYNDDIIKYRMLNYNNKLGEPINFNSNEQLAILLYDIIGVTPDKDKPRGVAESILSNMDLPLARMILEFRGINKLLNTYIVALPEKVEPSTGRLHASFNQNGADTGRFSSSNPNLQNIPRDGGIRHLFKATDGMVMVGADYSQQEPRITAHLCGDENMIQSYKNDRDLYATMASLVYNQPYEECLEFYPDGKTNKQGKKRRNSVKAIFLGICYGKGVPSIARDLDIEIHEAQDIYDSVMIGFPKFKKWAEDMLIQARKVGYTTTLWGRRRYLKHITTDKYEFKYGLNRPVNFDPLFESNDIVSNEVDQDTKDYYTNQLVNSNFTKKMNMIQALEREGIIVKDNSRDVAEAERQVVNGIVQGSAADMTKKALVELYEHQELKQLGFRLLMSVHDENIGECPIENVKRVTELLSEVMIKANNKCSVPMKCDAEVTEYWYGPNLTI